MDDEIIYMVADNEYDKWVSGFRATSIKITIKKNAVYKGNKIRVPNSVRVIGKDPLGMHGWDSSVSPFREINNVEALVLSKGRIRWLP